MQKQPFFKQFFKIGVLKDFANFTGKRQCWSLFLIKETSAQVFSCEICEIFEYLPVSTEQFC